MRARSLLLALPLTFASVAAIAQPVFDIPLRIDMGGQTLEDSYGRLWLGDGPAGSDPLNIRPNDGGGTRVEPAWCIPDFDSMKILGFDPFNDNDNSIFGSIRWDEGANPPDFRVALPVPNQTYTVNLYFNECCCPNRHFKVEIEGEILLDDVHYGVYDYDPAAPALTRVGRLTFEDIQVTDRLLDIGFLPCPECPGATDTNAIINAIEVISAPECDHLGLDFNCTFDGGADRINGTWSRLTSADSYRVLKNGTPLGADLPGTASSFTDTDPRSAGNLVEYTLQALDGGEPVAQCRCSVSASTCASDLVCEVAGDEVALSWSPAAGLNLTSYELYRNGTLVATLPADASSHEDTPGTRAVIYELVPITEPADQCNRISCAAYLLQNPFPVPLRLNMGGDTMVDSKGDVWFGDRPCGLGENEDPLDIRSEENAGFHSICNWCAPDSASFTKFGFDSSHPGDAHIFTTIRWDEGQDGINDFVVELPIPDGEYLVNLYFNECCCTNRHFKVAINGVIRDEDVSFLDYDDAPALGKLGRLQFLARASDELLSIGFHPCPGCPGAGDNNAIINAIEVLSAAEICETDPNFRECTGALSCSVNNRTVTGTWTPPSCIDITGYELYKDGVLLRALPAGATSFTDEANARVVAYELRTLVAAGEEPCGPVSCSALVTAVPEFAIPLRLNLGGGSLIDSRGRSWIGDGGGAGDLLDIRRDPLGGTNFAPNWCVALSQLNADSLASLGLDAFSPSDQGIFNTIHWDLGDDDADGAAGEVADLDGGDVDFYLELPIPDGTYLVNMYFTECCCPARHFQISIEDDIVDDDVSAASFSTTGALGRTGRLSFRDITVDDGSLSLGFLPCFLDCPDAADFNSIIDAVEVLPNDTLNQTCPRDLVVEVDGDGVVGAWTAPENVVLTGYKVYRDGEEILSLPPNATEFADEPPCQRTIEYTVEPLSDAKDYLCPGLQLKGFVNRPECPFAVPLRLNMGGETTTDSLGRVWLGDRPCSQPEAADPLEIRPDDATGIHSICDWCVPDPASFDKLGLDATHPGDRHIFTTIRWDEGGDLVEDFFLELPVPADTYDINLYFNECCCIGRHFKVSIQGKIVDEDVSYLDYDSTPGLGKLGVLTFEGIEVDDILTIGFLPCPECPGVADNNAIINAIEVLPAGGPVGPRFLRGNADAQGGINITDGVFVLNFLFQGGGDPPCKDAADADDSGGINITDGVFILNFLFQGGPDPAPPFGACGEDPTQDNVDCLATHPGCAG